LTAAEPEHQPEQRKCQQMLEMMLDPGDRPDPPRRERKAERNCQKLSGDRARSSSKRHGAVT